MIIIQLVLYCLLFTGMVRLSVRGGAIDGLYFYPEPVQERAIAIGLTDRDTVRRKKKRFMTSFYLVMLAALLLIVGFWNRAADFKTAYLQSLLFLEVMNWYDGIVIDKIWVGHSKFWVLPGTEDIPFVQTWKQVLKKRGLLTLIWVVGAAVAAGLVVLLF
ncbi:hypothetical protein [Marvinbryantia formatexigens]|nr:hypothetical protein [Marvinbryantia formatexigens]UWO23667.1 hypothetical protein NQ534_14595 [Marvinbryantia formatexigens DSM 14469]